MKIQLVSVYGAIAIFFLPSFQGYTANTQIDSLWHQVKYYYDNKKYDSAIILADHLLQSAKKVGDVSHQIKSMSKIAKSFKKKGDFDKCVNTFYDLLEFAESINSPHGRGSACLNLGIIFFEAYDYDNAIHYFKNASNQYELANKPNNQSISLYNIGFCFLKKKTQADSAIYYLNKALEVNPANYVSHLNHIYNLLGWANFDKEDYLEARENYCKSLDYAGSNIKKHAVAYNNIGETYLYEGNMEQAKYWLEMALDLKKSLDKPTLTLSTIVLLAKTHQQEGNVTTALDLLNQGLMAVNAGDVNANTMEALHLVTELHKNHSEVTLPSSLLNKYLAMTNAQNLALKQQKDTLNESSARYALQLTVKKYFNQKKQTELQSKAAINRSIAIFVATLLIMAVYLFYNRHKRLKKSESLVQDSRIKLRDATLEKLISDADYETIRRKLRLRGDQDARPGKRQ